MTHTLDDTRTGTETGERLLVAPDVPWVVLVWDDPVNLMSYVSWVFRSYFGYAAAESERLMMQVHTTGRAVVATPGEIADNPRAKSSRLRSARKLRTEAEAGA